MADAPYAGFLVLRSAQVARRDDTADIAAVSLGVIGPASGAEQTQRFIHRLTSSNAPQGWDTQVSNRPLVGLERARAWRFETASAPAGGAGADAILQAGGARADRAAAERPQDAADFRCLTYTAAPHPHIPGDPDPRSGSASGERTSTHHRPSRRRPPVRPIWSNE